MLDPFCGCATTCIAAEKLGRQWVGIDVSIKAYELLKSRLEKEIADPEHLFDSQKGLYFSTEAPNRTDVNIDSINKKYVYIISNKAYPNEYKVGIAKEWKSRLNSYQTSDPNRGYKIEHTFLTHGYKEIERHIHNHFNNKHEWVQAELSDIINEIKKQVANY